MADGWIDERTARQIRANYGAKLTFIDHQLGRLLDELDRQDRWHDTAVVVCTDHGHYLGEHDIFGKPNTPVWSTLGHIPLMIAWPGRPPGSTSALTTTVDLHATLCDVFGVTPGHRTHGRSLVPLLRGDVDATATDAVRDHVVTGVWGRGVTVTDGRRRYLRAPRPGNRPLSMWSNRWSTMPIHAFPGIRLPRPDRRATLEFMPGSDVPVIQQPFGPGDPVPFWADPEHHTDVSMLFDVVEDPGETRDLAGTAAEAELADLLRHALDDLEAPAVQFERLGLT